MENLNVYRGPTETNIRPIERWVLVCPDNLTDWSEKALAEHIADCEESIRSWGGEITGKRRDTGHGLEYLVLFCDHEAYYRVIEDLKNL